MLVRTRGAVVMHINAPILMTAATMGDFVNVSDGGGSSKNQ